MQYLLSEEELNGLRHHKREMDDRLRQELQGLCTLAAIHVPITRHWAPELPASPWGCILSKEHDPGYCDDCPARRVCPYERKRYSK